MTAVEPANVGALKVPSPWSKGPLPQMEPLLSPPANERITTLAVTSVRWGVTVNLGNFSSARLDAEAAVATGGSPESTLESLQAWVEAQAPPGERKLNDMYREASVARDALHDLKKRMAEAEAIWERTKRVFVSLNIDIPKRLSEDLPF